ncbi:MAG: hypothetical protein LBF16_15150 [Pseudomonadales bacterium]|jgi:hypothetical protein|nr:hypothetical protein [Pseudomonadales bacterium]
MNKPSINTNPYYPQIHVGRWLLLLIFGWLLATPAPAQEEAIRFRLEVTVNHSDAMIGATFWVEDISSPYLIDAEVEVLHEVPYVKWDLYIGLILPGGSLSDDSGIITWSADKSVHNNLTPIATRLDLSKRGRFSVSDIVKQPIEHSFTDVDPTGMYLVFALIVPEGADPAIPSSWQAAITRPLIVGEAKSVSIMVFHPAKPPDAVIIFTPRQTIMPLVSAREKDLLLEGTIESISGPVPKAIMIPAYTVIRGVEAGIPLEMSLMKFPDKDAYYPVDVAEIH